MVIKELKEKIENNLINNELIILKCSDNDFVATQYYRKIAQDKNLAIEIIDDLSQLSKKKNIFGDEPEILKIYKVDKLDVPNLFIDNLIIICNKVDKASEKVYNDYIVEIPKLEYWQIKDYAYSKLEGLNTKYIDWLVDSTKDIFRLDEEISRLNSFKNNELNNVFDEFINDGVYDDLTQQTIFNLTNSIIKRDLNGIINSYKEISKIDYSDMGFTALLYQAFKNVINIQLGYQPTPESCNLKPNQFYAIKNHNLGFYTKNELVKIFGLLTDVDRQIKTGEMPSGILLDYLLVNILGR